MSRKTDLWMPIYIGDYLADTGHLTTTQHGAYLLLLMHYWRKRELPEDDKQLSAIAKLPLRIWLDSKETLQAFFYDGWKHKRIESELERRQEVSDKRADAGSKGGKGRSPTKEAIVSNCDSFASVLLKQNPSMTHTQSNIDSEANASGAEAPLDPSIAEREYFARGREVLGKSAGGMLANLLKAKGGNVALARSAIETASTKQNRAEYVGAMIRSPLAKPLTEHQQKQNELKGILNDLDNFAAGGSGSYQENPRALRYDPGERSSAVRGRAVGDLVDISPGSSRQRG